MSLTKKITDKKANFEFNKEFINVFTSKIRDSDTDFLNKTLKELHPSDSADIIENLLTESRSKLIELEGFHLDPEIFNELNESVQTEILDSLSILLDSFLLFFPSFIRDFFYVIPHIETDLYGEFTSGGTHPSVIYYENFGYIGVFLIFLLLFHFAKAINLSFLKYQNPLNFTILLCMFATIPRFMWYGHGYFFKSLFSFTFIR